MRYVVVYDCTWEERNGYELKGEQPEADSIMVTDRVFTDKLEAERFAKTADPGRNPLVYQECKS